MIWSIKYGAVLTASNLNGSSLSVAVLSDTVGGTTNVTVEPGDVILNVYLEGGITTGETWVVKDGEPWVESGMLLSPGDGMMATGTEVTYQTGSMIVFSEDGRFTAVNNGVTQALIEAAIAALP